ncbi:MAG: phosphotransferase, partial [Bacteroidales bacterium]|nr:phosphotransferase [Bacteroidales bacterium]
MKPFLEAVKSILEISILRYLSRGFTNLMVSFGCTGGQHRSVYCAEIIAKWIEQGWPAVEVELKHTEQE